ncbi:MAG TPA: hypothetical protein VE988_22200 [Gemmataceae bacterium]|nr:hypothetical protein [Gemmataceae bacterium]
MERFARTIVGYHGCTEAFARDLLLGVKPINEWLPSTNEWDWLGHGIYFWEHAPERALRWATEKFGSRGEAPAVLGAVIQLGRCFDLLDETFTALLTGAHQKLAKTFADEGKILPVNRGSLAKLRELDCLVINDYVATVESQGDRYDTVRGAFLEGEPIFPGAGIRKETHLQIAVLNPDCILGVFQPNKERQTL